MKILDNRDRVGSLLLLVFALFYLAYTFQIPLDPTVSDDYFTPRTLPIGLAIATVVCSVLQLAVSSSSASLSSAIAGHAWKPMVLLTVFMLIYSLLFSFLGFVLASILFLMASFTALGERRLLVSIMVSVGVVLFMWAMLTQLFDLYLDSGSLFRFIAGEFHD